MKKRKSFILVLASLLCVLILGMTVSAKASGTAATIGSKKYASLESAIKAVKNGQTIVVKKNVSCTKPLTINRSGKKFTIDLNKKTITFANDKSCLVVKKGNVALKNGALVQKADKAYVLKNEKGAKLQVESGSVKGLVRNLGTMTVNKGTFSNFGRKTDLEHATIDNRGKMTINGGTVNGGKMQALSNCGSLTIKGGTFRTSIPFDEKLEVPETKPDTLIYNYGKGKLTINGGKFTSSALCILNTEKASVTVNKGKVTFTSNCVGSFTNFGKANIKGGSWTTKEGAWSVFYNCGNMTLSDVTVKSAWSVLESFGGGVITVKSGKFTSKANPDGPAMLIASEGAKILVKGGTFTGKKTWGYWQAPDGVITLSDAAKFKVMELEKEGDLFWSEEQVAPLR